MPSWKHSQSRDVILDPGRARKDDIALNRTLTVSLEASSHPERQPKASTLSCVENEKVAVVRHVGMVRALLFRHGSSDSSACTLNAPVRIPGRRLPATSAIHNCVSVLWLHGCASAG